MRPRAQYDADLNELFQQLVQLGNDVTASLQTSVAAFEQLDLATAKQVIDGDTVIDAKRDEIEQRVLILIALQQPVAGDLRRLLAALEIATELERIGDYSKRIGKATLRNPTAPNNPPTLFLNRMGEIAVTMLNDGLIAFLQRDTGVLESLVERENEIDAMEDATRVAMLALIHQQPMAAEWAMDRTLVAHTLERVADRVTNVGEQLVFAIRGERVDLNP